MTESEKEFEEWYLKEHGSSYELSNNSWGDKLSCRIAWFYQKEKLTTLQSQLDKRDKQLVVSREALEFYVEPIVITRGNIQKEIPIGEVASEALKQLDE